MEQKLKLSESQIIERLQSLGGNLWEKYEKRRIYFDAPTLAKILGYEWANYKTGNISSAFKNGERISNSQMKRVIDSLDDVYYDLEDMKFHWRTGKFGFGKYASVEEVIDIIKRGL